MVTVRLILLVVCLCVTFVYCGWTLKWINLIFGMSITTEDSNSMLDGVQIRRRKVMWLLKASLRHYPGTMKAYVHRKFSHATVGHPFVFWALVSWLVRAVIDRFFHLAVGPFNFICLKKPGPDCVRWHNVCLDSTKTRLHTKQSDMRL